MSVGSGQTIPPHTHPTADRESRLLRKIAGSRNHRGFVLCFTTVASYRTRQRGKTFVLMRGDSTGRRREPSSRRPVERREVSLRPSRNHRTHLRPPVSICSRTEPVPVGAVHIFRPQAERVTSLRYVNASSPSALAGTCLRYLCLTNRRGSTKQLVLT